MLSQRRRDVAGRAVACEIRVLSDCDELLQSYRLRDEVYGSLGYTPRNLSGFEMGADDPFGIPFGAIEAGTGALIGTLRLITNRPQEAYIQAVCQDLARSGDHPLLERIAKLPEHPLPSIISDGVAANLAHYNRDRLPVHELSRTIVRPEFRGGGVSRALMEFGLAYASLREPVVLIGGCLTEHLPMYARYGYVQLPRTDLDLFDSVGRMAIAVVCRTDRLPEPTRTHVELLRPRLHKSPLYLLARDGDGLKPLEGNY